jgi:hypothetical protein
MRRLALCLLLFVFGLAALSAQSARLRVTVGLCYAGYREETYSTILQQLDGTRWNVDLDFGAGALIHRVGASFVTGRTHSSVSDTATINSYYDEYSGEPVIVALPSPIRAIKARLCYGIGVRVVSADPYEAFAGGALALDALVQLANYPSVSAIISLGPSYRQRLSLGRDDRIELDVASPLLAYAVRPPYAGADAALMQMAARNPLALFATGSLLSLGRNLGIQVDAAYVHTLAPALDLVYAASASLSRIAFPLPRADAELNLRAGVAAGW